MAFPFAGADTATIAPVASDDLRAELRVFSEFGSKTVERLEGGIDYFVNEFWTSRQRQAHSLHEISYRACFKAEVPRFFIERLTAPGETVYDPFMGRGTTLVEAALNARRPVGNDANPLSQMLVRARLRPPSLGDIARRLTEIDWAYPGATPDEDLLAFYHPETLRQIAALRSWLLARQAKVSFDIVDDWIRLVALNRLTGHSSGFFSVYTLPPNQAVSALSQRKINAERRQVPPLRNVPTIILKKSKSLLADGDMPRHPEGLLRTGFAEKTPWIATASVDLIVTSPPFLDVVDYAGDNWLRCWFAGLDAEKVELSIHRKEADWQAFIRRSFDEFARIVKPSGHIAFEVGEVRKGRIFLEKLVIEAIAGLPFELLAVMVNQQDFTKTANCWGVANNTKGTNSNRILLLKRKP